MSKSRTDLTGVVEEFLFDPLGFVRLCFPWGEGDLAGFDGPDEWQRATLEDIGREALRTMSDGGAVRLATASGHGIGKTACMACRS